jgi:hypothetical protein
MLRPLLHLTLLLRAKPNEAKTEGIRRCWLTGYVSNLAQTGYSTPNCLASTSSVMFSAMTSWGMRT